MQIETIPEWALTKNDDKAIAALVETAFGPKAGFNGRSFFGHRHHCRLIIRDGAKIVGHAAVLMREVRMGRRLVPIIGVAEVATDLAYRGRGIASAIMNEVIKLGQNGLAEFVVLFGTRPIYAGLGFQPKSNFLRETVLNDTRLVKVKEGPSYALKVLPCGTATWDDTAVIDLAGPVF